MAEGAAGLVEAASAAAGLAAAAVVAALAALEEAALVGEGRGAVGSRTRADSNPLLGKGTK